jgi:Tol biopolymer transport system component
VIFFSNRDGHKWSLYTVEVASGAIARVTGDEAQDKHPQITPDGRTVIFHSDRGQSARFLSGPGAPAETAMRIFSLDLATGAARQLSASLEPRDDRHPFLSPDGRTITFHANRLAPRPGGPYEKDGRDLYLMTLDGSRAVNLTAEDSRTFKHPSFSADGTQLYFVFKRSNRAYNVGALDIREPLAWLHEGGRL